MARLCVPTRDQRRTVEQLVNFFPRTWRATSQSRVAADSLVDERVCLLQPLPHTGTDVRVVFQGFVDLEQNVRSYFDLSWKGPVKASCFISMSHVVTNRQLSTSAVLWYSMFNKSISAWTKNDCTSVFKQSSNRNGPWRPYRTRSILLSGPLALRSCMRPGSSSLTEYTVRELNLV